MDPTELTAARIATAVKNGEATAEAVAAAHFARIETLDPTVKAFLVVLKDQALASARAIDEKRKKGGTLGVLAGVPVALKDNICTAGVRTTATGPLPRPEIVEMPLPSG